MGPIEIRWIRPQVWHIGSEAAEETHEIGYAPASGLFCVSTRVDGPATPPHRLFWAIGRYAYGLMVGFGCRAAASLVVMDIAGSGSVSMNRRSWTILDLAHCLINSNH